MELWIQLTNKPHNLLAIPSFSEERQLYVKLIEGVCDLTANVQI